MTCTFCRIVNKDLPSQVIYEDEKTLAIAPLEQVSKGHTLILPKLHYENIFDIDEELFAHLAKVMKSLSIKLKGDNKATGINLLNASGGDAQQSVFHFHFHLVPRYPNDGLDLWIKQRL